MKRPSDKGLEPQYHIAEYGDFVVELKKYADYLEEENASLKVHSKLDVAMFATQDKNIVDLNEENKYYKKAIKFLEEGITDLKRSDKWEHHKKESADHEETNQLLVTANDNLIKTIEELNAEVDVLKRLTGLTR